jgi:hypothetical protein
VDLITLDDGTQALLVPDTEGDPTCCFLVGIYYPTYLDKTKLVVDAMLPALLYMQRYGIASALIKGLTDHVKQGLVKQSGIEGIDVTA